MTQLCKTYFLNKCVGIESWILQDSYMYLKLNFFPSKSFFFFAIYSEDNTNKSLSHKDFFYLNIPLFKKMRKYCLKKCHITIIDFF